MIITPEIAEKIIDLIGIAGAACLVAGIILQIIGWSWEALERSLDGFLISLWCLGGAFILIFFALLVPKAIANGAEDTCVYDVTAGTISLIFLGASGLVIRDKLKR
jgi:hypothetical protein